MFSSLMGHILLSWGDKKASPLTKFRGEVKSFTPRFHPAYGNTPSLVSSVTGGPRSAPHGQLGSGTDPSSPQCAFSRGAPLFGGRRGPLLRQCIFLITAYYKHLFPACQWTSCKFFPCKISSALSTTVARGAAASSFSRPRKPQLTPIYFMVQFCAV